MKKRIFLLANFIWILLLVSIAESKETNQTLDAPDLYSEKAYGVFYFLIFFIFFAIIIVVLILVIPFFKEYT